MSISDELMWRYFELLSFKTSSEIKKLQDMQSKGENPRNIKFLLAEEIVERFHGKGRGIKAKQEFTNRFQKGEMPSKIKEIHLEISSVKVTLPLVLRESGLASSTSEAMRLIKQGAVKVEGKKILDSKHKISLNTSILYQVGKRRFARVKVS
tara:strand:- start:49 stop:504 length:456 start_codon:yes stop_codon:yes gene_type:complete